MGVLLGVLALSPLTAREFSVFYIASPNGTLSWCRCPDSPWGGLPRRASALKEIQDEESNLLILDAGDLLAPFSSPTKNSVFVEAYSRIPVDAVALGDQEFIEGYDFFDEKLKDKLPLISANVYRNGSRLLRPYVVLERGGVEIVITSLIDKNAFLFYDPATLEGVTISDPTQELRGIMAELAEKGEVIILLSHLGQAAERKLAEQFPEIDIIVSGHVPAYFENPHKVGKTVLLGAGNDAKHFGIARFNVEEDSLALLENTMGTLTDKYAEDPAIDKIVAPYIEDEVAVDSALLSADTVSSGEHTPVFIDVFYAPDCPHCTRILKVLMPRLARKYPGLFVIDSLHNIDEIEEYYKLEQLEERYNDRENDVPVLYFEGNLLGGEEEAEANLERLLLKLRPGYSSADSARFAGTELVMPVMDTLIEADETTNLYGQGSREMVFFQTYGCQECDRALSMLKGLVEKDTALSLKVYTSDHPQAKTLLAAFGVVFDIPEDERLLTPVVFFGEGYLQKENLTLANLRILIDDQDDTPIPWRDVEEATQEGSEQILAQFERFGILPIIGAGLLDGINPCAFATLIFFITYLSVLGLERRKIIWVAIPFILSVFLTYFILGFVAYQILEWLEVIRWVSQAIFALTVLFLLFLAGMTFYDYTLLKRGKGEKMSLKLPDRIRKRMNLMIRKRTAFGGFVVGAVVTGFLVSLFELICTGQVYLPTLVYVVQVSGQRAKALLYLLVYNLAFILPLVVVFILVRFGLTEKHLQRFLTRRAGLTKVLTGVLFLVLAGVMGYLLIRGLL